MYDNGDRNMTVFNLNLCQQVNQAKCGNNRQWLCNRLCLEYEFPIPNVKYFAEKYSLPVTAVVDLIRVKS